MKFASEYSRNPCDNFSARAKLNYFYVLPHTPKDTPSSPSTPTSECALNLASARVLFICSRVVGDKLKLAHGVFAGVMFHAPLLCCIAQEAPALTDS